MVRHTRRDGTMRLKTGSAVAGILCSTKRLIARLHRFHSNGIRVDALSLLLEHGVDHGDQRDQADKRCDHEGKDRRADRYVQSQKQNAEDNYSDFKNEANNSESGGFAKVAVVVRREVCRRNCDSENCAADVHCEPSGCCHRSEPPEKQLRDQNDGCNDGDQRVISVCHFHHSFQLNL